MKTSYKTHTSKNTGVRRCIRSKGRVTVEYIKHSDIVQGPNKLDKKQTCFFNLSFIVTLLECKARKAMFKSSMIH